MSIGEAPPAERLSLGVAARLARYLQVLTQAKKEGKETVSLPSFLACVRTWR